jgi:hypothetical protein
MGRVAPASLAAVGILTPAPLRAPFPLGGVADVWSRASPCQEAAQDAQPFGVDARLSEVVRNVCGLEPFQ